MAELLAVAGGWMAATATVALAEDLAEWLAGSDARLLLGCLPQPRLAAAMLLARGALIAFSEKRRCPKSQTR